MQRTNQYEPDLTEGSEPSITDLLNANSNSLLLNFPRIPIDRPAYGSYELNARFSYAFSQDFDKNLISKHNLPLYDQIYDIINEIQMVGQYNPMSSQIVDTQPIFRRLVNLYLNEGVIGVCEDLYMKEKNIPKAVTKIAQFIVKAIDTIQGPIFPWFLSNKDDINFDSIKGASWQKSLIRAFEWHPHLNKYAVAFRNDTVKIYSNNHPPVVLKHPKQVNVTCLAWKPYYSSLIAIGCANCIIIWDADSLPVSIKPASSCSFVLSNRYHRDITDLKWYPNQEYLISVASKDNQIMIWDIAMKSCVPVKRIGAQGFSLCRFSTDGMKLFTADLAASFRVWNTIDYKSEKWVNLASKCNAACWSPDSSILLFSCENSSLLYSLRFLNKNKQDLSVVCDLSSVVLLNKYSDENSTVNIEDSVIEKYSIGGAVQNICWDSSSQRLAVSFKQYTLQSHINVVVIFIPKFENQFQLIPCGIVSDMENSWPTFMSFKPKFDPGALLTINWSNGRIQHVPLYFNKIAHDHVVNAQPISNLSYNLNPY